MTIHTVIGTGSDIQFAYVDRPEESDQFLLAGVTNQVLNAENKFSVIGDLSFLGADLTDTTSVEVIAEVFNEEGNRLVKKWGPVLVRDNTFLIEGCEEAVAQESEIADSSYSPPRYVSLRSKARNFKNELLREIVEEDSDPWARYLAIEMGPYDPRDYASQLAGYRLVAEVFDDDFVATNITPTVEMLESIVVTSQNDEKLIPGQKVPEFTLVNYDGEDTGLFELLENKDLVLIDFWASWCGPCIADFPELKKLHAAYTDEDFEIVGVSIDSTDEEWKGGVDEHELPWINLGEVKGWSGPVATMYGVNSIPTGFLVDSQGCIYKKNIRPAALKEFLVDRYGMDESLEEPEVETDDSQEVSS